MVDIVQYLTKYISSCINFLLSLLVPKKKRINIRSGESSKIYITKTSNDSTLEKFEKHLFQNCYWHLKYLSISFYGFTKIPWYRVLILTKTAPINSPLLTYSNMSMSSCDMCKIEQVRQTQNVVSDFPTNCVLSCWRPVFFINLCRLNLEATVAAEPLRNSGFCVASEWVAIWVRAFAGGERIT